MTTATLGRPETGRRETGRPDESLRALVRHCMAYRDAIDRLAWWQLAETLLLFFAVCALMLVMVDGGSWWSLILALPAGMLLVRLFTFQHDCGHGSFFTSKTLNNQVGRFLSVFTVTPYGYWKRTHALHHASAGDLGRRGFGDIDTLTVREYEALGAAARLWYRFYRHPLILHLIGPPLFFLLVQRSPWGQPLPFKEVWRSIMGLNVALVAVYGGLSLIFGPATVALVIVPVACVAALAGTWLFFVQHQFEHTSWDPSEDWHMQTAALYGSSYYILPDWVNWLTGNIALHHIHHLNSRVPGYRLQDCMRDEPKLAEISRLTWRDSIRCIGLSLWDEESRRLLSFKEAGVTGR